MKTTPTDTPEIEGPSVRTRAFYIAYAWKRVPTRVRENQVSLSLGWMDPGDPVAKAQAFIVELPAVGEKRDTSDVSGTLGLLNPVTNEKTAARANAFERSLSDLIKWLVLHRLAITPGVLVVIQGPMLPKLRGRFYYRGIEHFDLLALTFQPKWLAQTELSHTGSAGNFNDWTLSAVYPPVQNDSGSRCWTAWRQNGSHLHFEAIANLKSDTFDTNTSARWQRIIGDVLRSCGEVNDGLLLPADMLAARRAADHLLHRESLILYLKDTLDEIAWDLTRFEANPLLAEILVLANDEATQVRKKEEAARADITLFPSEIAVQKEAASRWNAVLRERNMKGLRARVAERDTYKRLSEKYAAMQGLPGAEAAE